MKIIPDFHAKLHSKRFVQIDTLIITRSYILILEVKNIVGTIDFKNYQSQIVRTLNDETTPLGYPFIQLDRNIDGISNILRKYGLNPPIHSALVFPSNNVIIENSPKTRNIFFVKQLPLFIQRLNDLPNKLSEESFHDICEIFTNINGDFIEKSLCDRFSIDPKELKKGIICSNCGELLQQRTRRTWICIACGQADVNPIPRNIEDLFILIKPEITMNDCLHYLQVKSRHTLNNNLVKMKLPKKGVRRATVYTIK